jgi:hypothetical protein
MRLRLTLWLACLVAGLGSCNGSGSSSVDAGNADAMGATAVIKFCNPISGANSEVLTLSLLVGTPPVTLTAASGTCTPKKGDPCVQIPTGQNVPFALRFGTEQVATAVLERIDAGDELVIYGDVDDVGNVTIEGGALELQQMPPKCSELAFGDIFQVP